MSDQGIPDPASVPNADSADLLLNLIARRRSIKPAQFSDQPVPDEIVQQMLEAANWAPTHGMTEPWRFFVYSGDARLRLGQQLADLYDQVTPVERRKPGKAEKLITSARQSSHLILIAMQRQPSGKIPEIEEIEAVACAVQNLHLAATAFGVGGYWSSGNAICNDQLRDSLGLTSADRVLGLFYVGYPASDWPSGQRTPINEKVVWARE